MPRRREGHLVDNEERVAIAALAWHNALSHGDSPETPRFWAKDIQAELSRIEPQLALNDSTINRALKRFVTTGWVSASWETADPNDPQSSKPRLYFRFTEDGLMAARMIILTRRSQMPLWALFPFEAVGEPVQDERIPLPARLPSSSVRPSAESVYPRESKGKQAHHR